MALGCPLYFHSVHSGTTSGDVKMNFGRAERGRYKKFIVPIYGTFLQKCYCESFHVLLIRCFITMFDLAPEECHTRALPMEEGFESLATMDLESAGADFDSVGQISKNITPDPPSSSNASNLPMEMPAFRAQQPRSPLVMDRLPHPCMLASPPLPFSCSGTPALSHPNTPPISPARSLPNTPPISPVCSHPNSPPLSPSLSRPNTPPISPAHSRPASPLIVPTGACATTPITLRVDHSMLEPTREGTRIALEVVSVEIRLRSGGRRGKKRRNEDVKEVNHTHSKRTRCVLLSPPGNPCGVHGIHGIQGLTRGLHGLHIKYTNFRNKIKLSPWIAWNPWTSKDFGIKHKIDGNFSGLHGY